MKEFHVVDGPHLKSKQTTSKMMKHLLIALLPIVLFSIYKNGIYPYLKGYATIYGMLYPLIMIFVSTLTTFLIELFYLLFFKKKRGKELWINAIHSYSVFPGLFLALILPINTPLLILIAGACFASGVGKLLFGGFGNNIFNPALIGRLFVITAYAIVISGKGGYLNPLELDAVSGATPLTNAALTEGMHSYQALVAPYGSLWDFFLGFRPGCLGETSILLCILGFIYLTIQKVIKWRIPVIYIGTVFFMTYGIGLFQGNGIWYSLFQVMSGGLFFGAIFMATDPVTSPTTPIGQTLYGLFLGILTVALRFLTPAPEGVLTSILTANMLIGIFDQIGSKARFQFKKSLPYYLGACIVMIGLVFLIGRQFTPKQEGTKDPNYQVLEVTKEKNKTTYLVTGKGYAGLIKGKIVIENHQVLSFEVLEQQESFYQKIKDQDYLNKLITEQKGLSEVDTVSGATVTSNALKKMLIYTIKEDQRVES